MVEEKTDPRRPANSRSSAARILRAWLTSGDFPDRALHELRQDRAFVMELVYGVIRWYRALEWVRRQFAPRRPRPDIEVHLWIGLYQLLFLDDVAEYAAINETVQAAKAVCGQKAANMVNAVLRRAQAEGKAVLLGRLGARDLGVRLSHPDLLLSRWVARFGAGKTEELCVWNNGRPDLTIRVNGMRTNLDALRSAIAAQGIEAVPHPDVPDAVLVLPHGIQIQNLPGFAEGWFYVQDPSTTVAARLLGPTAGARVLDACAAPGGKTAQLAEMLQGGGTLVAADVSAERIRPLEENLQRLGCGAVRVIEGEASRPDEFRERLRRAGLCEEFDFILLDVPCTNTGVIRRRPDAKWRFSAKRLKTARETQRAILDGAAALLAPRGTIVYSTCSLEAGENEEQVRDWLKDRPDFQLAEERQIVPPGSDGAYAARIVREG